MVQSIEGGTDAEASVDTGDVDAAINNFGQVFNPRLNFTKIKGMNNQLEASHSNQSIE